MIKGLVIPVCLAAYGLYCLLSGRGFIVGNPFRALGGAIDVHGAAATALARLTKANSRQWRRPGNSAYSNATTKTATAS